MYNPADIKLSIAIRVDIILALLVVLSISYNCVAQNINYQAYVDQTFDKRLSSEIKDSAQLRNKISEWISKNRQSGYFLAGLDSLKRDSNNISVYLHKGQVFKYVLMMKDSQSMASLNNIGIELPDFNRPDPYYWNELFGKWISIAADRAYPFAYIDISPIEIRNDSLIGRYNFYPGQFTFFHQTDQRQKKIIDDKVFNRLTGIVPGDPYNQSLVVSISDKIQRLPYLQMRSAPRVLFVGNEAIVWVYLEKARANKFDILLGLTRESTDEYRLTGEAGFELFNSLKYGEKIYFKYENLIKNSPKLKLGFNFPYIKYLPFGIETDFQLYRFGEEYIDLSAQAVVGYHWSFNQHSGVSFSYTNSSVLNPDTLSVLRTGRLPQQLDYSYKAVGLRHSYNSLDYDLNPSKGWNIILDLKAGTKKFIENNLLLSYNSDLVNIQQQYDSLNLDNEQARYVMNVSKYLPFNYRHVLKFGILTSGIFDAGKILDNELIRIGGYKNLRGFDEDFFKVQHALIPTIEYRFILDRNGFLNIFSDFAFLKQFDNNLPIWNWYAGFGAGIQFQTKIGNFSLQYAVGTSKTESISLGNGKIHFGYSALF